MKPRYFLDQDNDSHWFLIPSMMRAEWNDWKSIDPDDNLGWIHPEGVVALDGHPNRVVFEAPHELHQL